MRLMKKKTGRKEGEKQEKKKYVVLEAVQLKSVLNNAEMTFYFLETKYHNLTPSDLL